MRRPPVIAVRFADDVLHVVPGQVAALEVVVDNEGEAADVVALEVVGEPSAWAALRPATFPLGAGESIAVTLTIELPVPAPKAGTYPVNVRAESGKKATVEVAAATVRVEAGPASGGSGSARLARRAAVTTALLAAVAIAGLALRGGGDASRLAVTSDRSATATEAPTSTAGSSTSTTPPQSTVVAVGAGASSTAVPTVAAALTPATVVTATTVPATLSRFVQSSPGGPVEVRTARADGSAPVQRTTPPLAFGPYSLMAQVDGSDVLFLRNPQDQFSTAQLMRVGADGALTKVREVSSDIATWGYTLMVSIGNRWMLMYKSTEGFLAAQRWDANGVLTGRVTYPTLPTGYTHLVRVADGRVLFYNRDTGEGRILVLPYAAGDMTGNRDFEANATVAYDPGWSAVVAVGGDRVLFASRPAAPTEARVSVVQRATAVTTATGSIGRSVTAGVTVPGGRALLIDASGAGVLVTVSGESIGGLVPASAGSGALLTPID